MKIHQNTLILLLVICASSPTYSQDFETFKNKHVAPGMSVDECTTMIQKRCIKRMNGDCKVTNTFIINNDNKIQNICMTGENKTDYKFTDFHVIECNFDKKENEMCIYKGELLEGATIVLRCDKKVPVHYEATERKA
uniref:Ribonuclease A-domain domain-containing protein n=1 Tax=Cyprinus carpio carpio TaxID=630221 RepID=A0A9J8CEM2_CYPCA